MSKTRRMYFFRLLGRCIVLFITALMLLKCRQEFDIVESWGFFTRPSPLHILWGIWVLDMVLQLIPARAHISIGSQKVFSSMFRPIKEKINYQSLKNHIMDTTRSAYKVMLLWLLVNAVIWVLYWLGAIDAAVVLFISVFFYVCDLICVLIWCPFRLIMKNKCCTTCRIFNWDHLMMFTPLIAVPGFYSWSLAVFAFLIWLVWEICVMIYPERFWENSNIALKCSECTDKLCTQYCRKLREK